MDQNRELILTMLIEITEKQAFSHILLQEVLGKYDYKEARDKAFIKRVTEGSLERMIELDYIINQFSKLSVTKMKPLIACLLRMSVYQILYMEQVPDSAACNEAVKLAKKKGFAGLQGFVNGVLRTIARKKTEISYPSETESPVTYLSVCYSMPEWIVEKWIDELGYESTKTVLQQFLTIAPVCIRLREYMDAAAREVWREEAASAGIQVRQHPYLPYAYEIGGSEGIRRVPGFAAGKLTVQDISSMLVCEAAGIKKGDLVLDVCAAPGGKAIHAAEKAGASGKVIARDLTAYKTSLIRENAQRLDCDNLEVLEYDACLFDENMTEKADVVIADLPCSGLGIAGKKKDIKYRMNKEQMAQLVTLQQKMLSVVWQYVKPGGILMYSTCTINRAENEEMIRWFVKRYPFTPVSMAGDLPEPLRQDENNGMLQLLPGIHQSDGFFLAKLKRAGNGDDI